MKPNEAIANIEYARKWLGSESDFSEEALDMAIFALKKQEQIIEFIESRKQLHSSPVWYEFVIVKELDEVKRFIEKMQAEEES